MNGITVPYGAINSDFGTITGLLQNNSTVSSLSFTAPGTIILAPPSKQSTSLSATAPTTYGAKLGSLPLTYSNQKYSVASVQFPSATSGYVSLSGLNSASDTEVFALDITDSTPVNLSADLGELADQLNDGQYAGYTFTASTSDPTGRFDVSYNFFVTISGSTLQTTSPNFGFDLGTFSGSSDTLSATSLAGTAVSVPEPTSLAITGLISVTLLRRRRRF